MKKIIEESGQEDWGLFEKMLGNFRYLIVNKHVPKSGTIIDIGCGRKGAFLLSQKDKIEKGYGFDFRIVDKTIDNLVFINNKDMDILPIENNSIDAIFLNAVLEHLTAPEQLLSDCYRTLKKGGRIIMTTPTIWAKPILEFLSFKLHLIDRSEIEEHQHYYTKDDVYKLAKAIDAECSVEKYRYFECFMNSFIILQKN